MIKYLKEENLQELVKSGTYLVDFYADWCGPCKMLASVLENMEDVNIIKVNVDEHPEIAKEYGVMSIPLILVYKDGQITNKHLGFIDEDQIRKLIKEK